MPLYNNPTIAALMLVTLAATAIALPASIQATCHDPPVGQEWRTLSTAQKHSYVKAVLCLTQLPAISGIPGTINRFDDFHAVHNDQTPNIHWVGHFILWHRYFLATYETALRQECNYTGGQPYRDCSLDISTNETSTTVFNSSIFSPTTGFGGNGPFIEANSSANPFNPTGRTGGGCVQDSPFTYPVLSINFPSPHCLTRDFIPWIMNSFAQQSLVDHVLAQSDYTSFARAVEMCLFSRSRMFMEVGISGF